MSNILTIIGLILYSICAFIIIKEFIIYEIKHYIHRIKRQHRYRKSKFYKQIEHYKGVN